MNVEHLEARVERLERVIRNAPLGALCEMFPTRENLLDFWKQFKAWRLEAYVALNRKATHKAELDHESREK